MKLEILLEDSILRRSVILKDDKWKKKLLDALGYKEADTPIESEEDLETIYNNLDELGRDDLKARFAWYIIDTVPGLSRYKKLTTTLVKSILEDGFDDRYNLFLKYILNLGTKANKLSSSTAEAVLQLINNNRININDNLTREWLYNDSLYDGNSQDIDYKLKSLIFASDKDNLKDFGVKEDPRTFILKNIYSSDGKTIKSAKDIKAALDNFSKEELSIAYILGLNPRALGGTKKEQESNIIKKLETYIKENKPKEVSLDDFETHIKDSTENRLKLLNWMREEKALKNNENSALKSSIDYIKREIIG